MPKREQRDTWVLTSYFNPGRYSARQKNYEVFSEHLEAPLVAVELSPDGTLELRHGKDFLLRRRGNGDLMWQKERLLNIALSVLPSECRYVVWADCDIVFNKTGWLAGVREELEHSHMVQLFRKVYHLKDLQDPRSAREEDALFEETSIASRLTNGASKANAFVISPIRGHGGNCNGMAWAARRDLLDMHGFYDGSIAGGGDTAMAGAAFGCFDQVIRAHRMNEAQKSYYLKWAEPFCESVDGRVSFVDGDIFHLWHGSMVNRNSVSRHKKLRDLGFNPYEDIRLDNSGLWAWNTEKTELHEYLKRFFAERREDG